MSTRMVGGLFQNTQLTERLAAGPHINPQLTRSTLLHPWLWLPSDQPRATGYHLRFQIAAVLRELQNNLPNITPQNEQRKTKASLETQEHFPLAPVLD